MKAACDIAGCPLAQANVEHEHSSRLVVVLPPWVMPSFVGVLSNRPTIVCLCGSTRFSKAFQEANLEETLKGNIVLTVGSMTHSDAELGERITPEIKTMLDALHLKKIELADEVLVLNCRRCTRCGCPSYKPHSEIPAGGCVDGHDMKPYIGESTTSEIKYATRLGKPIRYLNG